MSDAPYMMLPFGRSGEVALVDAADFPRLSRYTWHEQHGNIYRNFRANGRKQRQALSHELLNLPPGEKPEFINGNRLDFRRANLRPKVGNVIRYKRSQRNPYRVQVGIDYHTYCVGGWPSREQAEQVRARLTDLVRALRGQNLPRRQIQRQLDQAAGRKRLRYASDTAAAKLLCNVAALIPAHTPADVREEAAQAIAVDVLAGVVTHNELDARTVRAYVRAALGLRDQYRFRSLDAPVSAADERTLAELLAA